MSPLILTGWQTSKVFTKCGDRMHGDDSLDS